MILNIILSFSLTANIMFPLSKPNPNPGIGREFIFYFKLNKIPFYFSYSEAEILSGSEVYMKNYEAGFFLYQKIKRIVSLGGQAGFVYTKKEKLSLSESSYIFSFGLSLSLAKDLSPLIGFKSFFDGDYLMNYFKIGILFNF